jgi:glyoxylase-like metal-dependent hydrolase (beta-lactamase superfamily II)
MLFRQLLTGSLKNFSYIIADEKSGEAAVVDPVHAADEILDFAEKNNLGIKYLINTHQHFDHILGNRRVTDKTGAKVVLHSSAKIKKDIAVEDGDVLRLGETEIKVVHTPGHTPDSISLLVGNKLLTGDTLYVGECGRTDLPGGDPSALYDSLFGKISKMDDTIEIYPGHDYGRAKSSTLGYEKRHNYTLQLRTREEFIKFMNEP